jgi:hypothetical protein
VWIIDRWSLHSKLWIINVDDNFDHFFSTLLNWWFGSSPSVPIPPIGYHWVKGWTIARRNARWRVEDAQAPALRCDRQQDDRRGPRTELPRHSRKHQDREGLSRLDRQRVHFHTRFEQHAVSYASV